MMHMQSEWERHKLSVAGLARYSVFAGALALVELLAHAALNAGPSLVAGLVGLGLSVAVSAGVYGYVAREGVEAMRPLVVATLLTWALSLGGACAAVASGGFASPYAFGLVPAAFGWALCVPNGARSAAPALLVALLSHLGVLGAVEGKIDHGAALVGLLALSVAFAIASAEVIHRWREQAAAAARTDALTGALTAAHLEERLRGLCSARQRELAPVSVVMIDIDRFKDINAEHGRDVGDRALVAVASAIRAEIRASDFFGRTGPDELVIALDHCEGRQAAALVDRLRARAERSVGIGRETLRLTFSAGICSAGLGDTPVAEELLEGARRALEASKESALNRTVVAPPPFQEPRVEPTSQPDAVLSPPADGAVPALASMRVPETPVA